MNIQEIMKLLENLNSLLSNSNNTDEEYRITKEYTQARLNLVNQIFSEVINLPPENLSTLYNEVNENLDFKNALIAALLISGHDANSLIQKKDLLRKLLDEENEHGQEETIKARLVDQSLYDLGTPLTLAIDLNSPEIVELLITEMNVDFDNEEFFTYAILHRQMILYPPFTHDQSNQEAQESTEQIAKRKLEAAKSLEILNYLITKSNYPLHYWWIENSNCNLKYLEMALINKPTILTKEEAYGILSKFLITNLHPIHLAAQNNYIEVIKSLAELGEDVNLQDVHNQTALHLAITYGNLDVAKYLIEEQKADLNLTVITELKFHPLFNAAARGHLDLVKYLIEKQKIDPNPTIYHTTPLYIAVERGHLGVVKYLIEEQNVDPNRGVYKECPLLNVAAKYGHLDIVKYLIEELKMNVDLKDLNNHCTPLHVAAEYGRLDIVKYLIEELKMNVDLKDLNNHCTPLHVAAEYGRLDIMKYLIEELKMNVDLKDLNNHCTPLHVAAKYGRLYIMKYLIEERKANPNIQDQNGITLLHLAIQSNYIDIVNTLIKAGADLNIQDNTGFTPLQRAIDANQIDIVKSLVKAGADITYQYPKEFIKPLSESIVSILLTKDLSPEYPILFQNKSFIQGLLNYIKFSTNLTFEDKQKYLSQAVQYFKPQFRFIDLTWWQLQLTSCWINLQALTKSFFNSRDASSLNQQDKSLPSKPDFTPSLNSQAPIMR